MVRIVFYDKKEHVKKKFQNIMVCRKWAPGVLFQFLFSLSISNFYIIHVHIYKKIEFERLIEIERELHGAKKMKKKIFFPKNRAPGKAGISRESRNFRDFFSWFFPKIKFSTSPYEKKFKKPTTFLRDVQKLNFSNFSSKPNYSSFSEWIDFSCHLLF